MKRQKIHTILLSFLLILVIMIMAVSVLSVWHIDRQQKLAKDIQKIERLHQSLLEQQILIQDFIEEAPTSRIFYEVGYEHVSSLSKASSLLQELTTKIQDHPDEQGVLRDELLSLLEKRDRIIHQLILKIEKRGFENYGCVGCMRKAALWLEKQTDIDLQEVLMLRR